MNNENKDPDWKELADYLRKLNLEFYWNTVNMVPGRSAHRPPPPPRLSRKGGITMGMGQEHMPPEPGRKRKPVPGRKLR